MIVTVDRNICMTVLFTELNRIIFTALYRTFSTSHGIEFTVNDRKIFYGLILLSFTVCNRINYVFLKSVVSIPELISVENKYVISTGGV